jgi:hypothetical protein
MRAATAVLVHAARADARVEQQAGPMAELERAQQAHVAFEAISRCVASVQEREQKLYDEAVIIFEATLRAGQKMTGAQRDTLWYDAEQTDMNLSSSCR